MNDPMEIEIEPAAAKDVPAIVSLHMAAFRNHFLTDLGERFLKSYYHLVLDCPAGILMVAKQVNASCIIGFVGGSVDKQELYTFIRKGRSSFFIPLLLCFPRLLRSPKLVRRLFHLRRRIQRIVSLEATQARTAELASVAVNPIYQGRAVGKRLVLAFNSFALARGAEVVTLITDAHDNMYVNGFYDNLGFQGEPYTDSPVDRLMIQYRLVLIPNHVKESEIPSAQ